MYLKHFGLSTLPFTLSPDTEFFYHLPHQQEAVNMLMLGLRMGEGFMKVTGEIGTGKTFLSRYVADLLKNRYKPIYILNPHLNKIELLHEIANELDVENHEVLAGRLLLNAVQEKILKTQLDGKKVVIFLDEAQAVSLKTLEALRLLTNLETKNRKLIQVILFGQPELNEMLMKKEMRPLRQRILFSYHLKQMTFKETVSYIRHRLYVAGKRHGDLFDEKALRKIFKVSGGNPRVINILAHKALMAAFGEGCQHVFLSHVSRAISDTKGLQTTWLSFSFPFLTRTNHNSTQLPLRKRGRMI